MSDHGARQIGMRNGGRGFSFNAISDTMRGTPAYKPSRGMGQTWRYQSDDATIIMNQQRQIVSAWPRGSGGVRNAGGW